MSDIDLTQASGAAYRGWRESQKGAPLVQGEFSATYSRTEVAWMVDAVLAALPHIERQVREQVAREIEARQAQMEQTTLTARREGWINGLGNAARIARGDS